MQTELLLLFSALLGSVFGLAGGLVLLFDKRFSKPLEKYSVPFAAGVLITVALLGLLPESLEHSGESVFMVVLVSFFGAFFFEHAFFGIHHHTHDDHKNKYESSALLVILGDTLHNFIDGVAIGASFMISPGLGLITAFSTFLHEVPHEIGDFGILLKAKWRRGDIILVNLISAVVTIVSAFGTYMFALNQNINGILLAVSGGIFLYLGASDFLPHVSKNAKVDKKALFSLVLGILIMFVVMSLVPHAD